MSKHDFKVCDRVRIVNDRGWQGICATVIDACEPNHPRLRPDAGSRYAHTGDFLPSHYLADAGTWSAENLELIEAEITWGYPIEVNGVRPAWLFGEQHVFLKTSGWLEHTKARATQVPAEKWAWSLEDGTPCITAIKLPADHFAYKAIAKGFEPWGGGDSAPDDWDKGATLLRDGETWPGGEHGTTWGDCGTRTIIGYKRRAATAAPAALDWAAPIEYIDGTPLVIARGPDRDGDYLVEREDGEPFDPLNDGDTSDYWLFNANGEYVGGESRGPLIRNRVAQASANLTESEVREIVGGFDAANRMIAALGCRGQLRTEPTRAERFAAETGHEVTDAVRAASPAPNYFHLGAEAEAESVA